MRKHRLEALEAIHEARLEAMKPDRPVKIIVLKTPADRELAKKHEAKGDLVIKITIV